MIVKIECKKCKHILATIATGLVEIPEWINKWLNKTTCPKCDNIAWRKGE